MELLSSMSNPNFGLSNNSFNGTQGPGGPVTIKGTGLTLYGGGVEKTPTGMSNAAAAGGVTPEIVLTAIKEHNLPTTSNKEFQEALIKQLASTELGQQQLAEMEKTYGPTKSGSYVDNILGARTKYLLNSLDKVRKIKEIEGNRPAIITTSVGDKIEKILDFGTDHKANEAYWNYFTSQSGKPAMRSYVDSLSKNLAPKGAKYLTTMQEMSPVLDYEKKAREEFYKKFGHYPPTEKAGKLIVPLSKEKQDEALSKYLGFKQ